MDNKDRKEIKITETIREPIITQSPPLTEEEIRGVYRNEFYIMGTKNYFHPKKGKRNRY